LLAAIWAEHESRDYSYMNFYTDLDVDRTVLWRKSPVRWFVDDRSTGGLPELNAPAIAVDVGGPGGADIRHIVPGSGRDTWFKDDEHGPEMVLVPAGEFQMGLPEDEIGLLGKSATPRHRGTIAKPFAVSRYQITFDEWEAALAAGGVHYLPDDGGWGRGRQPVINVSWSDARTYADWLSARTGRPYRLLTEAEWEYVARAGTTTPFWWGNSTPTRLTSDTEVPAHTQVDGLAANPWGLFHVHGDLSEWCEDAWNDDYVGAPRDGSASSGSDPGRRVIRGSWQHRAGERSWMRRFVRAAGLAFRVARSL